MFVTASGNAQGQELCGPAGSCTVDQVHPAAVRRSLKDWVEQPSEPQLELLASLSEVYERNGVLKGTSASALYDCCPDAGECWAGAEHRVSRNARLEGGGEDGSIFWPFVGRGYRPGGVCVVGWNINHDGEEWYGLQEEFVIADYDRARLGGGWRANEWRSMFAYRSLSAGIAVADSLDGADPVDELAPESLAEGMQRLSRLQSVKCVPRGDRSNPEPAMTDLCPRRYLVEELAILRPAALVILGENALNGACNALEADKADSWITWDPQFDQGYARGTQESADGDLTIFGLWHPSYGKWPSCHERLIADLRQRPLGADPGPV